MKNGKQTYFFCGIGGIGMSALAQILLARGFGVAGSDRAHDQNQETEKFGVLQKLGVQLYPQDGSGIAKSGAGVFVVSSAVEDTIPDVVAAKKENLRIIHRADLLAELAHTKTLLAVGGTSGKSTVTGMLGHILMAQNHNPTIINGAVVAGQGYKGLGNVVLGGPETTVIEADESDGSIRNFKPQVAVLNNISLDHKPLTELRDIFTDFLNAAQEGVVLNADCAETMALKPAQKKVLTFSLQTSNADFYATNITPLPFGIQFKLNGKTPVNLKVFGAYNVANALAAIGAANLAGVSPQRAAQALESFAGMRRRLETLGQQNGITVIDDFAHNPHKLAASLSALKAYDGRLIVVYQPHGFGPTKMMRAELVKALCQGLGDDDILLMPEIYYVGGTADKSISSADLVADVKAAGKNAYYFENRPDILPFVLPKLKPGDRICVMGARDNSLTDFARLILENLQKKSA